MLKIRKEKTKLLGDVVAEANAKVEEALIHKPWINSNGFVLSMIRKERNPSKYFSKTWECLFQMCH